PYKIREHLTKPLKCEVPSPARQPTSVPSFRLFLHPDASSITGASLLATDPRGIREKSHRCAPRCRVRHKSANLRELQGLLSNQRNLSEAHARRYAYRPGPHCGSGTCTRGNSGTKPSGT